MKKIGPLCLIFAAIIMIFLFIKWPLITTIISLSSLIYLIYLISQAPSDDRKI